MSLLQKLVEEQHEKVILWSFYTGSIDAIVGRYSRYGVLRYDGTVSDVAERRETVRRFQEDDTARLFVANPAAAGAGLTLHRARFAIYESLSTRPRITCKASTAFTAEARHARSNTSSF